MSRFSLCRNKFALLLFSSAAKEQGVASVHVRRSFFLPRASFATTITIRNDTKSPTIAYLVDNCGLSSKSARSVSKKFKLKSTERTDSILQLLRDCGFSDTMIAEVVSRHPFLLSMKSENLKPKLDLFRSAGFSDSEIVEILSANPHVVAFSLEKTMAPSLAFMRTFLSANKFSDPKAAIFHFLKCAGKFFMPEHALNFVILRSNGVPEENILNIFVTRPRCLLKKASDFAAAVEKVKEFGVEPKSLMFLRAVDVLCYINPSAWDNKVDFFKSLGWSTDQICSMFKRTPYCFAYSEELIKKKMDFFTTKLGWDAAFVAAKPVVLQLGIEKRFIPRCSVLNILMSKGLITKNTEAISQFIVSDEIFHKQYVTKFEKEVPEIAKAYRGKIAFKGWV